MRCLASALLEDEFLSITGSPPRLALLLSPSAESTILDFACLASGMLSAPIHARASSHDRKNILALINPTVFFCETKEQALELFGSIESRVHPHFPLLRRIVTLQDCSDEGILTSWKTYFEAGEKNLRTHAFQIQQNFLNPSSEDPVSICFTPGVSSSPKGVLLSHRAILSVLESSSHAFQSLFRPRDRIVSTLSRSHALGKVESYLSWTWGWQTTFASTQESFFEACRKVKPTLLFGTPHLFETAYEKVHWELEHQPRWKREYFEQTLWLSRKSIRDQNRPGWILQASQSLLLKPLLKILGSNVRAGICGGESLPREVLEFFAALGMPVFEGYGLTETCAPVTANTPAEYRPGTCGKPMSSVAIKTTDEGEVWIKTPQVHSGYLGNPDHPLVLDSEGWLHTGDLGFLDDEGFLVITERKDDVITLSSGDRVSPARIENVMRTSPWIREAFITGNKKPFLTALVTLNSETVERFAESQKILYSSLAALLRHPRIEFEVSQQIELLNDRLKPFERVQKFTVVPDPFSIDEGQLSASLKIRRGAIDSQFRAAIDGLYSSEA